jgi:hypothetical protein
MIISLAAAGLVAGVHPANAQSVTLEQAVARLHATLASIPHLNESDLLSDEAGTRYAAARQYILDRQCLSRNANPLLAIAVPVNLNLRGTLDSGTPPVMTNSFELSLRVASLSELPNEYLKGSVGLMNSRSLPEEVNARLKKEIPETRKRLEDRVAILLNGFDARNCPARGSREISRERGLLFIFVAPTY